MKSNIVNVFDTEWTCYENGVFPEGERKEPIEFGLTTVDIRTRVILQTISIPIVPVMSRVSDYCTSLTGWTYERLKRQGITFEKACKRLIQKYGAHNRLLVVDSTGESFRLREHCQLLGVEYPFGIDELNVSTLFCLTTRQKRNISLEEKLQYCQTFASSCEIS